MPNYPNSKPTQNLTPPIFNPSDSVENASSPLNREAAPPEANLISTQQDWSNLAQELLNTLPRAWTKGLLYLLFGITVVGLPWAAFSQVDETGAARGRLEPKGKSFQLDAPVAGTVTRIHAKVGQPVKAGQALLELDAEPVRTELGRTETQLRGLQSQAAQQGLGRMNELARHYTLLQAQLAQDLNEVQRYRGLQQQGVVPQVKVAEVERTVLQSRQAVSQARSGLEQAQTDLKTRQIQLRTEIAQTQKQLKSLQFQLQQRTIRSPANGTVFEFPIQQAGAVVQPSQRIAQIAPEGNPLVLRAQLPSQDSGFIKPGLPVKLKFDAYPFQDYGVVQGQLQWISPDSKLASNQEQSGFFEIEVSLDQSYVTTGRDRQAVLMAGQTATAEVIVRQRRVIDFVLEPLKKLQQDGLKL